MRVIIGHYAQDCGFESIIMTYRQGTFMSKELVHIEKTAPGIVTVTMNHPPVNTLNQGLRDSLYQNLKQLNSDPRVKAIILTGEGEYFSAGADISEFKTGFKGATLVQIQKQLENSEKITIAAINGDALGGGLEIALACHFRVTHATSRLILPEVTLGLIPGAGGTQRLPRLIGIEAALSMIVSGKAISGADALQLGLVDYLTKESEGLIEKAQDYAKDLIADGIQGIPTCEHNERLQTQMSRDELIASCQNEFDTIVRKVGLAAPTACVDAVLATLEKSFKEGIEFEQSLFLNVLMSEESRALQYIFFATRRAAKLEQVVNAENLAIHKIGVVGGGLMGSGIAMSVINHGLRVILVEADATKLKACLERIQQNFDISVKKGRFSVDDVKKRMQLITGTTDINELNQCDFVIEAVFEDMDIKKEVFQSIANAVHPKTIVASNTSALDIDELAQSIEHPERVIGLHFFSPANVSKLLEVVVGAQTNNHTIQQSLLLAKSIKKNPVLVGVCPGFVGNRMIFKYVEQANQMLLMGNRPQKIDHVMEEFGFPMGPFAMSDLTGLDLAWQPTRYPESVQDVMCINKLLGQKTRQGFYQYDETGRKRTPYDKPFNLLQNFARKNEIEQIDFEDNIILKRLIFALINEGFKILDEKVVKRASDIDVIYIYGYGWPPFLGGPMYYAEQLGLNKVLTTLDHLAKQYGDDFKPPETLRNMVKDKSKLKDWGKITYSHK